jgi:hypothetical protein
MGIDNMREFLRIAAIVACVVFGAIGGVALLVSGWTILLVPFWGAAIILLLKRLV